jgi:hypothetical protein
MCAVEMGLSTMIYIPRYIKIDSGIQKLMGGGGGKQTHRHHGGLISKILFIFK